MSEAGEGSMDLKNPDTIEDLRALLAAAAPGPWHLCRANGGECFCGLVWSVPADCVVATCSVPREDAPGDEPVMARHRANGRLLAAAVTHLPELLDRLEAAEAEAERLRDLVVEARQIVIDVAPGYTVWLDEAEAALGIATQEEG